MEKLLNTHIVKYQALMQILIKMKLKKLQKILKKGNIDFDTLEVYPF